MDRIILLLLLFSPACSEQKAAVQNSSSYSAIVKAEGETISDAIPFAFDDLALSIARHHSPWKQNPCRKGFALSTVHFFTPDLKACSLILEQLTSSYQSPISS